ncbi:hypothetical protein BOC44_20825 (plasmid) [Burkholderia pseudomallei]|nr:hypothetical protein BOC44_20825 [Burkholderia pseudomallei]
MCGVLDRLAEFFIITLVSRIALRRVRERWYRSARSSQKCILASCLSRISMSADQAVIDSACGRRPKPFDAEILAVECRATDDTYRLARLGQCWAVTSARMVNKRAPAIRAP